MHYCSSLFRDDFYTICVCLIRKTYMHSTNPWLYGYFNPYKVIIFLDKYMMSILLSTYSLLLDLLHDIIALCCALCNKRCILWDCRYRVQKHWTDETVLTTTALAAFFPLENVVLTVAIAIIIRSSSHHQKHATCLG